MKAMVAANKEPWKTSFLSLSQNPYASYNYTVRGNTATTVIDATTSDYDRFKYDGLAAYYNALMWYMTGDTRHANKAVEIFNAWVNIKRINSGGTKALDAGRVIWKMLEGAEIIKNTYSGWQQTDIDKFKAMLVYPGYSNTTIPQAAIDSQDATFYWYMYNGDPGRYGNQGIFAYRGLMSMGIFMDNRIIYDRALRYLKGQPHRSDDIAYQSGPAIVSSTKNAYPSVSTDYYDDYSPAAPYYSTSTVDYGYDDQIQYYFYPNGQTQESSRDQGHALGGISNVLSICEIAWNQGDDIYSILDNRPLLALEYNLKYNATANYSFTDQPTPWEPTVENGEFLSITSRSGRWKSLKINPWTGADLTSLTRGLSFKSDQSPIHEMVLAHYRDRVSLPEEKYKWTQRVLDLSMQESGYEQQGFQVDHPGYGGLTFHRPKLSSGDPVSFINGRPVYKMNTLPGTIEAENFDYFNGNGQGKTYNDLSNENTANQYRTTEGVDIQTCAEGGYNVTDMQSGEWLDYTVSIPSTGFYKIKIRYSSTNANGKIRFDFDGEDKTGEVTVPFGGENSTGSQDWKDFTVASNISIQKGVQSMKIFVLGTDSAYNLNNITIEAIPASEAPIAPSDLSANAGNSQVTLTWTESIGAQSYKIKRSTTNGGPYTTIASSITSSRFTNTGLINGTTYYYAVSAVNAIGEGQNTAEVAATPDESKDLVKDNFDTLLGNVTGRIPQQATIGNRVFESSSLNNTSLNTVAGGMAKLATNLGEVINISTGDGYIKPKYIKISGSFNMGTLGNNSPARVGRGVYFGFWSAITGSVSFQNMRGVFINPEDGELHLWNGSNSTTATPVQTLPYNGTWNPSANHTISYAINTETGNISEFVLDGQNYLWNKTNIFLESNTNYAGFGISAAVTDQYGGIDSFSIKDNKVWNEVARSPQSITFGELADRQIGDSDFSTLATSTSSLPLTYTSSNTAVATVGTDGTIHITGIGSTTITASQAGNTMYESTTTSRQLSITNNGVVAQKVIIEDGFDVGTGSVVTDRTPDISNLPGKNYQISKEASTNTTATNVITGSTAKLYTQLAEVINITSTGSYVKPTLINISATFDMGNLTNNSPIRTGRGIYIGFYNSIPPSNVTNGSAFANMRGIMINPENGKIHLWDGNSSTTAVPPQSQNYNGTWIGGTQEHTLSYTVNTTTGNISDFILDGITYTWSATSLFNNANTAFAGFGVSSATANTYGNFKNFKVTNAAPQLTQTITFPAIATKQSDDLDFNPKATASSTNPISYSSSNTAVATIVNGLIHIIGEGQSIITAIQAGNADYLAATASQTLTVLKGQQILPSFVLPTSTTFYCTLFVLK
ncbi:carbohydrate-binding protein [uncultured Flavobacterium sp.]|uniref:carbohydrate-binding protein n=1 Tax=uncultured Flavobacterium sp. TaxID=165435 RepID=UPI00259431CC|nr:carbohydrate-binding protein [uncultured Flavobacterium sp.]